MNSVPSRTRIRTAVPEDADALLRIYSPYVKQTAITFEYEVPSTEEFTARIKNTLKHYPYLVAEQDGKPIGYAYTGPFVGRAACSWAAETSIVSEPFLCGQRDRAEIIRGSGKYFQAAEFLKSQCSCGLSQHGGQLSHQKQRSIP